MSSPSAFLSLTFVCSMSLMPAADVIVLKGASGSTEYEQGFNEAAEAWKQAANASKATVKVIDSTTDKTPLATLTQDVNASAQGANPLWLVLIGHGTADTRDSHFNLPGPDLTVGQLADMLEPIKRELIIVDTTAASGSFIKGLSGTNRTIVTATKGAEEVFFARFGEHFARAIGGLSSADRDQDQQVSVLEAFLFASSETKTFYEKESRIATEHALLDDNGDSQGTRSEAFDGLRPKVLAENTKPDGLRARQLHLVSSPGDASLSAEIKGKRDQLENQVRTLVQKKASMPEEDYYRQLEALFLQIAKLR